MATLEEAIAGTRRGERWEMDGIRLHFVKDGETTWVEQGTCLCPRLDGWTRVEEKITCPACGSLMWEGDAQLYYVNSEKRRVRMGCSCGVSGPWRETGDAAREAWLRIGAKR